MSLVPPSVYKPLKNDVYSLIEKQHEKWERFFFNSKEVDEQPAELPEVRDVILQSWNRCKEYEGLNPLIQGSVKNISDEKLKEAQSKNGVFHLAQPVLKQAEQELANSNHAILFCDSDGIILDCYGDLPILRKLGNSTNAVNGANWSERWAGTNAIGTSILVKQPVQIFSSEHFAQSCHQWVCSSAPILNPLTNELLGVINLSTTTSSFNPISMMKTIEIANKIERILTHNYYQAREMIQTAYIEAISRWKNQMVILCDSHGKVLRTNSNIPLDEITSLMSYTLENDSSVYGAEWENEANLNGHVYQVRYKKLKWYEQVLGLIAVLEKKNRFNTPTHNQQAKYSFQNLVGQSESFNKVLQFAKVAASSDSNVLITGDSGTGKELVANAIHQASTRADYPFIALNCAAIPKDLLPSELFGYESGAFTGANPKGSIGKFEQANKGTLFLDEIGDMPLESQVQLLRVIQEQEIIRIGGKTRIPIDVRVIAATNKNFMEEIQNGTFRKDLYYRLNVIPIELPSLRQRAEDIPILAQYFIQKLSVKKHQGPYHITEDAMNILRNYSWPGNIRELENVIEYAITFSVNGAITPESLPKEVHNQPILPASSTNTNPANQAELDWILSVLKRYDMNVSKASQELNMSRSTVYRKLKKLGYDMKNYKKNARY